MARRDRKSSSTNELLLENNELTNILLWFKVTNKLIGGDYMSILNRLISATKHHHIH